MLFQDSVVLVYVVFAFGILSMFKYVPSMPTDCDKAEDCPRVAARGILTGYYCEVRIIVTFVRRKYIFMMI